MNEVRVESTTLRALAYDGGRGILQLEFSNEALPQTDEMYFRSGLRKRHNRRDGSGRQWRTASSSRQ